MDLLRVGRLIVDEQVARFGMAGPGGRPRLTPVPFAVINDGDDGVIVCSLDVEPRSLVAAAQLRSIATAPRVSILIDRSEFGRALWWIQAEGVAEVIRRGAPDPRFAMASRALSDRYRDRPAHAWTSMVWITVTAWNGWTAATGAAAA